jgi:2-polyprenyl-6-methoxyphenol hydroxylase-like FAD-dependent oxidoreductase
MGDAAHVHSPAGGQGMNTGIVDAAVLGAMLTEVVRGARPDAWLGRYGALRRPAALEVIDLAGRLTRMATTRTPVRRAARNAVLSLVDALPSARHRIALSLSGLARRGGADLAA